MKKYIDADELKKFFRDEEDAEYTRWTLAGVLYEIDDIEAADVEEVRHGHWIDVNGDGRLFECSVCGRISCCNAAYCNECGAKMDEVEE